ncbi:MAG TPA: VCBS repeat-containing protein [Puia sp.]|nr:VCBS repeat-containing protein [Puia sp.]
MGYFINPIPWPIWLAAALASCTGRTKGPGGSDSSVATGERLANIYCQTCHEFPAPGLLNRASWLDGVLPAMGPRLGIFEHNGKKYPSYINDPYVGRAFYPAKPLLSKAQWQAIIDYYAASAPDSLRQPQRPAVTDGTSIFAPVMAAKGKGAPAVTLTEIDTAAHRREIVIGDMSPGWVRRFSPELQCFDSIRVYGAPVAWRDRGDSGLFCNIGEINPNNGMYGSLSAFSYGPGKRAKPDAVPFLRGLARPVDIVAADLNQDGKTDYLVCEFGNLRGALSWTENLGKGQFVRHVLREQPGAIKAYVRDANGDGLPDIWVLFAQGDEGIFLYLNQGHGQFKEVRLLRFPPVYGSSYFELDDLNGDGHPDIVYTCGDNADFSPVLKPYHGIYVFLNDGSNHFTQRFFYHLDGCYKAIARDFDGDGRPDIAAISFFADYARHPEDGFVYLENKGNWQFQPHTVPGAESGRWLTMDAGDIDGDGKPDLVLGNFSVAPAPNKGNVDWKKGPPFLVLRNIRR